MVKGKVPPCMNVSNQLREREIEERCAHKLGKFGKHETLNTIETNSDEENVSDVIESTTTSSSSALTEVERVELERVTSKHAVRRETRQQIVGRSGRWKGD